MRHTISILIANEFGELSRVVGLFSGRGFNIESLCVAETLDRSVSRITLVTSGNDQIIEQIVKQLRKLVRVVRVTDVTRIKHIEREMALINVAAGTGPARQEVLSLVNVFRAKVVDISHDGLIIEASGTQEKVEAFINLLRPFGIREIVRTGKVAMGRLSSRSVAQLQEGRAPQAEGPEQEVEEPAYES